MLNGSCKKEFYKISYGTTNMGYGTVQVMKQFTVKTQYDYTFDIHISSKTVFCLKKSLMVHNKSEK